MKNGLLMTLGLAVATVAQDREPGAPVFTTLAQVRAEPAAYRNVPVEFVVQFVSLGRINNPFFTKFTPNEYANFYVWGDEQPIWRESAFHAACGTLFLSKDSQQLDLLYGLKMYDRVNVVGVVRNTFQNMPWFEVTTMTPLPTKVDNAVLTHLYRGEQLMADRQWGRAIAELNKVPGKTVPETALTAAYQNLGTCLLRVGEAGRALPFLQSASTLTKGKNAEIESLLATAANSPAEGIDRGSKAPSVRDAERPMWEAFEPSKPSAGSAAAAPSK